MYTMYLQHLLCYSQTDLLSFHFHLYGFLFCIIHWVQACCPHSRGYGAIHWSMSSLQLSHPQRKVTVPAPAALSWCQLLIVPQLGMEQHEPIPQPMLECWLVWSFVHPWLQWVHEHRNCLIARRQCVTLLLLILHLFCSFHLVFCNVCQVFWGWYWGPIESWALSHFLAL